MTTSTLTNYYSIDKLEMSLRFGKDNFGPKDFLAEQMTRHCTEQVLPITYSDHRYEDSSRCTRYAVTLSTGPKEVLFIELGTH